MAYQNQRGGSTGAKPDVTKTEKTAPNRAVVDAVPGDMSRVGPGRAADRTSHYGRNGYSGPSSLAPFERTEAAGARLATVADPDLARVRDGQFGVPDQLRDIGAKNVKTHPFMSGASKGPQVPDKIAGSNDSRPVRKR